MNSSKQWKSLVSAALLVALAVTGCGVSNQAQSTGGSTTTNATNGQSGANVNATQGSNGTTGTASIESSATLKIGNTAPDFTLANISGKGAMSLKQLLAEGKPVLINAWASWCPPCNAETPDLVKMERKYGKQVQFVGLNLTAMDSIAQAKAFVSRYSIPYPVLLDPKGVFQSKYGVVAEPTSFMISPQGKVLEIDVGMMMSTQMEQFIQKALNS